MNQSAETIFTGTQAWSVETIDGRRYYTTGKGRRAVTAMHSNGKWTVMAGASTFSVYRTTEEAASSRKALRTLPSVVAAGRCRLTPPTTNDKEPTP